MWYMEDQLLCYVCFVLSCCSVEMFYVASAAILASELLCKKVRQVGVNRSMFKNPHDVEYILVYMWL